MVDFVADIGFAFRRLRNSPTSSAVAIASIALGIGVSTAILSVVDRILFAALPYPESERVVTIEDRTADGARLDTTYGTYVEIAARNRSFETLAVADRWLPALTATAEPEQLAGDQVSADYFRVLGVGPALGRQFEAADYLAESPRVAIVSAGFAQRRFGSAEALLNRPVVLNGQEHTVVGVMPNGFENVPSPAVEVWAPLRYRSDAPFLSGEWGHHLRMMGRLVSGVALEQAQRELTTISGSAVAEFPRSPGAALEQGLQVASLQASVTSDVRPALLAILGAVLLLLAIACANVTNILLARALARSGELALRAALGAARGSLVRQLFAEGVLHAAIGGVIGLALAALGIRALVALAPAGLPRANVFQFDARVFLVALAVTAVVALVVGLVPALRRGYADASALQSGRATPPRRNVLRRSLVVTQVALTMVLLVCAGLLLRSVDKLLSTPVGFEPSQVLTMQVVTRGLGIRSSQELLTFFQQGVEAVRGLPDVIDAAFTSQLPLSGDSDGYGVLFESADTLDGNAATPAFRYAITPTWFETMRIPLLKGRLLGSEDGPNAPRAVLINESLAARHFGGRDPIGARLRMGPNMFQPDAPWSTVVGVVGDVKQRELGLASPDAVYVPLGQWNWVDDVQSLVVRTRGEPTAATQTVKQAIWAVNPAVPFVRVAAMSDLVGATETRRTFALTIFTAFGFAALLLAGAGVYGVVEASVRERTREIGVRSALGASPAKLVLLVLRQAMSLTSLGVVIGLGCAVGVAQALVSLLFGVEPFDLLTGMGAAALLIAVALLACGAPAWRAARVDPALTLRAE